MSYHIFISYRRRGASELAMLLFNKLTNDGYAPFLDMESMRSGMFNEQIYQRIDECSDMLVLLPESAFDSNAGGEDWMRLEIAYALQKKKNVIPVLMRGFKWPDELPEDIALLHYRQGVEANMEYFDAMYDKICHMLTYNPRKVKKYKSRLRFVLAIVVCLGMGTFGTFFASNQDSSPSSTAAGLGSAVRESADITSIPEPTFFHGDQTLPVTEANKETIYLGEDENGKLSWFVLSADDEYTELISSASIATRAFGTTNNWETSSLRQWLNDYYLYYAFSSTERNAICLINGDAIRIPDIDEACSVASSAAIGEHQRSTFFSMTACSDSSQMLYTVNHEGNLGMASPGSEQGIRIIVKMKNDFLYTLPGFDTSLIEKDDSELSNLSILADSHDNKKFRIRWDGVADQLWIFLGPVHAIYAERSASGLSSFTFHDAIPNTTYTVNLYAGEKVLSQSLTTPKAMLYDHYGATNFNSAIRWLESKQLKEGLRPWEADHTDYRALSKDEFIEKLQTSSLYCQMSFMYKTASPEHQFTKMWVVRSPSGDAYWCEKNEELPANEENCSYSFYQSINELIGGLHQDIDTIEEGTYVVELYFDDQVVGYSKFIII